MFVLPEGIRGLIFDCDGTLADTMPMHVAAFVQSAAEYGFEFPPALVYEMAGAPAARLIEEYNQRYGKNLPVEIAAAKKEKLIGQMIPQSKPIEPVVRIVRQYAGKLPLAVATGGTRENCIRTLQTIGLEGVFAALVTVDEVPHGKPAPDIYLEAARRIDVSPMLCCAFEDAQKGLESARAAGMMAVDIHTLL